MKVFIVHAHHERQNFNAALTKVAYQTLTEQGHSVEISDLYGMNFDPVSDRRNFITVKNPDYFKQQEEEQYATQMHSFSADIQAEINKLFWCDVLIFQFPLWWFGLPGILKGWVDRVFAMGIIYGGGRFYDNGVLQGRKAMLSLTTGGPETMYSPTGLNGDINNILFPINHGIFRFVGFDVLPPFVAYAVARGDEEQRRAYLEQYRQRLLSLETTLPIQYPSLSDYESGTFQLKNPAI
ncbi:NQO1, NAD (plasmid) [Nostoc flagelliforme CCNUN1]|uniref:NQO1, NAD n=1 Tax=Nostoc flagelliforme CCNUN1 TaxID=2038116 RepID=A0A2K8T6U9_9NOSO|nr:NAD(P)H-dependent oxidoreductase [Nostoc flagelliforme]AUB43233.1 NQO1, NAD [Nostoc flagelliforme CCNUN1]AUB43313.1 NQO1, NAD [Nostoc flagelliforme CCNUN1]